MVLKLLTIPWDMYWDEKKNRFDFVVTWVFVVVSVWWASPLEGITADMLHYFTILRLLRLLALLGRADQAASEGMYEVLVDVMRRADTGINVGYAIVYEGVRTITKSGSFQIRA